MKSGAEKRGVKEVKLREVGVEDVLKDGFGGVGREYETRATDVQMGFERWVSESDKVSIIIRLPLSLIPSY
jgi:ATP-dependent RNA helicase DDX31/DBP7